MSGSAVAAVAGGFQHPGPSLLMSLGQALAVSQGQAVPLHLVDAGLDPACLLGRARWAGSPPQAVALGEFALGALACRIITTDAGNGTRGMVDDHPRRHAVEPLEGTSMAG